jgi:hypothetical protein
MTGCPGSVTFLPRFKWEPVRRIALSTYRQIGVEHSEPLLRLIYPPVVTASSTPTLEWRRGFTL